MVVLCVDSWMPAQILFLYKNLANMQKIKSMGLMHIYLNSNICRKVIVECTVRLGKHFKWWPMKILSRPSSALYFHSWLGWWNRRWTVEMVRWPQTGRACKKIVIWSRGVEFKVILINCYKELKINKVKFNESKCNVQHTKSMTEL